VENQIWRSDHSCNRIFRVRHHINAEMVMGELTSGPVRVAVAERPAGCLEFQKVKGDLGLEESSAGAI
jgi:hypothetical protein